MVEREQPDFFDERFETLAAMQEALSRHGFTFLAIAKEHTEGLVTSPLIHRIHTQTKKRGFHNIAGRVILTFSGYSRDPREIHEIPEIRRYWQQLDRELPELPALPAYLPQLGFNGPGLHVMLLGQVDALMEHPAQGRYDVHVADAPRIIADATRRIRDAGRTYHLDEATMTNLIAQFRQGGGEPR